MALPFGAYYDNQFARPRDPYLGRGVYFILCNSEYVKIGYSEKAVKVRINGVISGVPYPCQVLLVLWGKGLTKERELHKAFAHLRIQGEWFHYKDDLKAFIDQNSGPGTSVAL